MREGMDHNVRAIKGMVLFAGVVKLYTMDAAGGVDGVMRGVGEDEDDETVVYRRQALTGA